MPITYGQFTKIVRLLPLTLDAAGGATISLRYGFTSSGGQFIPYNEAQFTLDSIAVSSVLDANPTPNLTRRDDLSLAVYQYLVTNGLIEAGIVS